MQTPKDNHSGVTSHLVASVSHTRVSQASSLEPTDAVTGDNEPSNHTDEGIHPPSARASRPLSTFDTESEVANEYRSIPSNQLTPASEEDGRLVLNQAEPLQAEANNQPITQEEHSDAIADMIAALALTTLFIVTSLYWLSQQS